VWDWIKLNSHLLMGWFWVLMIFPTLIWWSESIMLVLAMSLYANIEASFSAHHAKKSERQQEKEDG
jgi:hypothetical protein